MMKRYLVQSISVRLVGAYMVVAALALTVGLVGYVQIGRVNATLADETAERAEARHLSTKARMEALRVSNLVEGYLIADSETARVRLATQLADEVLVLHEFINQIEAYMPGSEEERAMVLEIVALLQDYLSRAGDVTVAHASEAQRSQAVAIFESIRAQLFERLIAFEDQQTSLLYASRRAAQEIVANALTVTIALAVAALVGGALLGWWISGTITRPVGRLVEATRRIAAGELGHRAEVQSQHEVGMLARAFNRMASRLQELVGSLEQRVEDLTRAEDALRRSEERYRSLFEGVPIGIYRSTPQGKVEDANPALLQMLGYTDLQALQVVQAADLYVHAEDRVRWQMLMAQKGVVRDFEAQVRRYDGGVIWTRDSGRTVRDEEGRVIHYEGTLEDVTKRKEAEDRLRKERDFSNTLIQSSPAFFVALDTSGKVMMVNDEMLQSLGYTLEEVVGADYVTTFIHEGQRDEVQRVFVGILGQGATVRGENPVLAKSGQSRLVEWYVGPVLGDDDEVDFLFGFGIDITERRRMEEELQAHREHLEELVVERTRELAEANAELAQYAYVVSHDVRAPLRAIHNYADFLREDLEGALDGDQRDYLNGLGRAVGEAEELVEDLLELSRIGRRRVPIETIDVGAFLRDLIAVSDLPSAVDVVMPDKWPTLKAEPVLLRQVFQNLLDNAAKFNDSAHKRVELGWQPVGEGYEFSVRDNGIGIAPRHHEQIFRVFERLHTKEEYEGTGIGLAIVKKAASRLGGTVRLESQLGEGSTFFVTLPEVQKGGQA